MPGSHRRRHWLSSWWSRKKRPLNRNAYGKIQTAAPPPPAAASPCWSVGPTREVPVMRYAPLMTLAQTYRGNGGRWSQ